MFGYVSINPQALGEAEKHRFRAFYCGLCRVLLLKNRRNRSGMAERFSQTGSHKRGASGSGKYVNTGTEKGECAFIRPNIT